MAFANSQGARVLLGSLNYSGYTKSFSATSTTAMLKTTTIADAAEVYIPGAGDGSASLEFLLDSDGTLGNFPQMTAWHSSQPAVLTYAPYGLTTGSVALLISADQSSFDVSADPNSAVAGKLAIQATDGVGFGNIIEDLTSISATGNGTARDFTAGTTNGGVAHMHITAFSGSTSSVVTIESSANGTTGWTTRATFTAATGITSQRVVVAAGTTIDRYLRVVDTLTGTPTYTRSVSFSRR